MSDTKPVLGRRKLLVLGAGAAAIPACSDGALGPDGPYPWDPWAEGGLAPNSGSSSGGSGSASGGNGSSSGGSTSSSSGGSNGGSSSGNGTSSSSTTSSSSGFGTSTSSSGNVGSNSSSGGSTSSSSGSSTSSSGGSSSGGTTGPCSTTGKIFTLSFSQYPQLMNAGGSVAVNASGYSDPACGKPGIIVVCKAAGQYVAVSSGCSHQCCAVSFVSTSSGFRCPCHGATFDITGKSTSFIAPLGLANLSVCSDSTGVHVTLA